MSVLFIIPGCEICEECEVCPECLTPGPTPDPTENPFEWEGTTIISDDFFLDPENWNANGSTIDEGSTVFTEDLSLKIAWEFGDGVRAKWVQRYIQLPESISFADVDIVAFDIRGSNICGNVGFELKFEGDGQAAWVKWENLARLYRWGNKITVLKKQCENYDTFNWSDIRIVSLAVYNILNCLEFVISCH